MTQTVNKSKASSYFQILKHLDNKTMKEIIDIMKVSIETPEKKNNDFSACFGTWEDDRSVDQIVDDIYSARVNSSEIEELL